MSVSSFKGEWAPFFKRSNFPPEVESEVTTVIARKRVVTWGEGRAKIHNVSSSQGLCARILSDGAQGIMTTTKLDDPHLDVILKQTWEIARVSPRDPHRRLAKPSSSASAGPATDSQIFSIPAPELLEKLKELESQILKFDTRIKKAVKLQYFEGAEEKDLANSWGLHISQQSTSSGFSLEILAEEKGETEVAWDFQESRFARNLNYEKIANEVALHAVRSLGGELLSSGSYAAVLHPRVGSQLLDLLSEALSAENVQLGRSYLQGCLAKEIASDIVNLADDPFLPDGVSSASIDDEGTPHQTMAVMEKGILKDYFYDLRSASKDGLMSNGHGIKESLGAAPRPRHTNFYLVPGKSKTSDMLNSSARVFFIHDVMGLHMADRVTGEFSFGASGYLYEKGKFARSVRGVTVAGTVPEVIKKITAVGEDLTWYGDIGCPTLLVAALTIAGT